MPTGYTKPTGGGYMEIRDYPERSDGLVEFYVKAGSSSTNHGGINFSWTYPGGSGSVKKAYPTGAPLLYIGGAKVATSGNVTFNMAATGTVGLGGPTSFTHAVSRQTKPPAPTQNAFTLITHTSARLTFSNNGTGGSPIIEWQTSFGTNASSIEGSGNSKYTSTGTINFNDLQPGTAYHAWTRGKNALGWGAWSSARSMTTLAGVKIKVGGVWKNAVPYVKDGGTWKPAIPYFKDGSSWKSTKA